MRLLMRSILRLGLLFLLGTMVRPVQAQLLFNLNPAGLAGIPGGSVTFNATLINTGNDTVWLNGDSSSVAAPGLTIDDADYFIKFPLFLAGGDTAAADLFTVAIGNNVASGDYFGSFTILGGADANAQDILAMQNFQVSVVPEPGSFALLIGSGVTGILFAVSRMHRSRSRHHLYNVNS